MDKQEVIERVQKTKPQHKMNVAMDFVGAFITERMMELAPEEEVSSQDIAKIESDWRYLVRGLIEEGIVLKYTYFIILIHERMEEDRTLFEYIKLN